MLYRDAAEAALICNLIGHSDGFVESALSCLQTLELINDACQSVNPDEVVSVIRKLCNLILLVPGNPNLGATYIPKSLLTHVNSQSWITISVKTRTLCGVALSLAALAKNRFQCHTASKEVLSNDLLFFGDSSYHEELKSFSGCILESMGDIVQLEQSKAARGRLAVEACNCIALSFKRNQLSSPIPAVIGLMQALAMLDLSCNNLSGPIPPILGNLSFIEKLYLHGNKLTGPVPLELGNMTKLHYLELNDNELKGRNPSKLGKLTELFDLRTNEDFNKSN